jgi:hypothetical protein
LDLYLSPNAHPFPVLFNLQTAADNDSGKKRKLDPVPAVSMKRKSTVDYNDDISDRLASDEEEELEEESIDVNDKMSEIHAVSTEVIVNPPFNLRPNSFNLSSTS